MNWRRTGRGNDKPWRASRIACFHYHKLGHLAKFCRARMNQLVNQSIDRKGKKKVDVEEVRSEMNKIWRKKSEEKPLEQYGGRRVRRNHRKSQILHPVWIIPHR